LFCKVPNSKRRLYHQFCGLARALDFVGERWTLLIIRDLLLGPKRYSDLLNGLPGLTTNLLAKRLKELEQDGLIEKTKVPPPNPASVYQLTNLGLELEPFLLAGLEWGHRFLTRPTEEEVLDIGWSLLRLKNLYKTGYQLTFEVHTENKIYHSALRPQQIAVRDGPHPDSELRLTGPPVYIHELFFGPTPASELPDQGLIVVEGKFGRWPRLLAAFGLS